MARVVVFVACFSFFVSLTAVSGKETEKEKKRAERPEMDENRTKGGRERG